MLQCPFPSNLFDICKLGIHKSDRIPKFKTWFELDCTQNLKSTSDCIHGMQLDWNTPIWSGSIITHISDVWDKIRATEICKITMARRKRVVNVHPVQFSYELLNYDANVSEVLCSCLLLQWYQHIWLTISRSKDQFRDTGNFMPVNYRKRSSKSGQSCIQYKQISLKFQ